MLSLIDCRAYPMRDHGQLESAGTDPRPGANRPSPTTPFTDLLLQKWRGRMTVPATALRLAWLVQDIEVPMMRADWPVLQQADQISESHLQDTQKWNRWNKSTQKIEETICSPGACHPGIRKRGDLVWFCVSRRPHMLCRIRADGCRVNVTTDQ